MLLSITQSSRKVKDLPKKKANYINKIVVNFYGLSLTMWQKPLLGNLPGLLSLQILDIHFEVSMFLMAY